jgi:hypothetical protein
MADQEILHVKLGLSGTFVDKRPEYRISFNGTTIKQGTISEASGVTEYVEFDIDYEVDQVSLSVELLNKNPEDTIKDNYEDPDNYKIIGDLLLNVVNVVIEDNDLGQIPYKLGVYSTDSVVTYNGEPTQTIRECMSMGWNGKWTLTWTNPFYIWYLENM